MPTADLQVPARPAAFVAALEGLTRLNVHLLEAADLGGMGFPPLYSAGVRYKKEPREIWRHAGHVLREGWGDCEDLAAWRAAELRVSGEDPGAMVAVYQSGPNRYHAVVGRGDGRIEDPSRVLGMKTRKKGPATMHELPFSRMDGLCSAILGEEGEESEEDEEEPAADIVDDPIEPEEGGPALDEVVTDVRPTKRPGYRAVARVPLTTGRAIVTASSRAPTPDIATTKALNLASRALDSPAAQALLPPGAKLALNVMRSPQAQAIARGAFKAGKKIFKGFRRRKRR